MADAEAAPEEADPSRPATAQGSQEGSRPATAQESAQGSAQGSRPETAEAAPDLDQEPEPQRTRFALTGFEGENPESLVSIDDLISFVFPADLYHPLSTGRLYAFGFYGPLDRQQQLRSGPKGQHVLGRWELDAMCHQFEREDCLQVYVSEGRALCTLSEEQQNELISQADARMKSKRGKGLMPQLSKDEVRDIFEGVETSPDGTMRFHEMQQRVLAFREDRIKKMRVMYPLVARKPLRVGFGGSQTASRKSLTSTKRSRRTTAKVSPAVAPPTMFQKDKGLRNSDVATRINRMLCTRAYKICDIGDNTPELTQNVALIREDDKDRELGEGPWSCLSKRPSQEKYKREMLCVLRDRARANPAAAVGADAGELSCYDVVFQGAAATASGWVGLGGGACLRSSALGRV